MTTSVKITHCVGELLTAQSSRLTHDLSADAIALSRHSEYSRQDLHDDSCGKDIESPKVDDGHIVSHACHLGTGSEGENRR